MQWSEISFTPPSRTLRQFAILWVAFFLALACWQWFSHENLALALAFATAAVTFGPLGVVKPQALRPIFVGWMVLVFPIGWTISRVVLAALYYVVFSPIALVFRLVGRDALRLRRVHGTDSYWTEKPQITNLSRYFRQF